MVIVEKKKENWSPPQWLPVQMNLLGSKAGRHLGEATPNYIQFKVYSSPQGLIRDFPSSHQLIQLPFLIQTPIKLSDWKPEQEER